MCSLYTLFRRLWKRVKNNHEQIEVLGITLMASNVSWMNEFDTLWKLLSYSQVSAILRQNLHVLQPLAQLQCVTHEIISDLVTMRMVWENAIVILLFSFKSSWVLFLLSPSAPIPAR